MSEKLYMKMTLTQLSLNSDGQQSSNISNIKWTIQKHRQCVMKNSETQAAIDTRHLKQKHNTEN